MEEIKIKTIAEIRIKEKIKKEKIEKGKIKEEKRKNRTGNPIRLKYIIF
ncbi:hypothetical protein [Methanolapillus africanus]